MVHIKLLLDTRRRKADGTFSIIFRITDVKKTYTITSGVSITERLWDEKKREVKKSHPNASSINAALSKKYFEIQRAVLKLEDNQGFSYNELREILEGKAPKAFSTTFKAFAENIIREMLEVKRTGNAIVYQTAVNRLISYCGNPQIGFKEIDYTFLDSFSTSLKKEGMKQNTIANYLRSIRAIYNKAIKARMVDRSLYPFYDIRIKSERTAKRAVTRQDIKLLVDIELKPNSSIWHARNYFLLSFYLIGISFTDLAYLKHENVINGRVEYRRRKTHKHYSVKLFDKAMDILKLYCGKRQKYLLPILPDSIEEDTLASKKIIYQGIKNTNKYLKRMAEDVGINATLTTYVARHTWATTAKRLGYSIELIAEAMGHEHGNKITNIYLDTFDKEVIDKMHEAVIG